MKDVTYWQVIKTLANDGNSVSREIVAVTTDEKSANYIANSLNERKKSHFVDFSVKRTSFETVVNQDDVKDVIADALLHEIDEIIEPIK